MRKKKLLSILVVTAMTAGVLVGCGGSQDGDGGSGGSTKKNTEAGTFTMAISTIRCFWIRKMELSTTWRTVWRYPKMD